MKKISIGSWAYTIGPYADNPVDFETVCSRLAGLGFDGVELHGANGYLLEQFVRPTSNRRRSSRRRATPSRSRRGISSR